MNDLILEILEDVSYRTNPYFMALQDGSMSFDDFVETQKQFYFAVIFFSRPMAALAAKIPSTELRIEIIRNVWEEHGEGDPERIHGKTFETFLARLTNDSNLDLDSLALWPEIRQFNTTLAGACVLDEYLIGAAMLGIIERMFCEISTMIGEGVVQRGWLSRNAMIHYNLHEEIDLKHSQDFFNVLQPAWDKDEENRYYIEQGLRLGATAFNLLYEGLFENRSRRLSRMVTGPHSRS
jgi:pyrroloquinoline-quinone synthase